MSRLSIIIVNYNVRYFLEQCLRSVEKASKGLDVEIIVVDNHSSDDSLSMIMDKFPDVILIQNQKNVGFSKANNQGLAIAKGEFILILNPDTILSEDCLKKCIAHLELNPQTGALCVRMIDGSGTYLPESKRGHPTPAASFFKMLGINKIFPGSPFFNAYYAAHIQEFESADIDVMTGAFMFLRREVYNKVGGLDESFFMYGEDIDYSYRIRLAGYKILYFPEVTIIHFKGESTKKSTFNYTKTFYQAMAIFVQKHYQSQGLIFIYLLKLGVFFKGLFSLFNKWVARILPQLIDLVLVFFGLRIFKNIWVSVYFNDVNYINETFNWFNAPLYSLIWIFVLWLNGHYFDTSSPFKAIRSILAGTLVILGIYALLPNEFRNSRLIILAGTFISLFTILITKLLYNKIEYGKFGFKRPSHLNVAIVAGRDEYNRIKKLMESHSEQINIQGRIAIDEDSNDHIGHLKHIGQIIEAYHTDEVIFSQKDIPASLMMTAMSGMRGDVDFRVAPDDTLSIIKSNSKNRQGQLVTVGMNFQITIPENIRRKRMFDIFTSIIFLVLSPITLLFLKKKENFVQNLLKVLTGHRTMIGYIHPFKETELPELKPSMMACNPTLTNDHDLKSIDQDNLNYAQNYTLSKDIEILYKNIRAINGEHS